jgi:HEAT repeat protein
LFWFLPLMAVVFAAVAVLRSRQPHYAGRPLAYWVFQCDDDREAEKAVRAIGTNALPFLLDWISRGRPPWKENLGRAIRKVYGGLGYGPLGGFYRREEIRGSRALGAFAMLGETARPAVPELTRRLQDPKFEVWYSAMQALGRVGKDGVPPLAEALTNQANPFRFRYCALWGLEAAGTNASPAIPAIVKCLDDKDSRIGGNSAMLLGGIGLQPELVVPALTNCLRSSDQNLRWAAVEALGRFGQRASPAVSLLRDIILEADPSIPVQRVLREEAEEALFKIEAEEPE